MGFPGELGLQVERRMGRSLLDRVFLDFLPAQVGQDGRGLGGRGVGAMPIRQHNSCDSTASSSSATAIGGP